MPTEMAIWGSMTAKLVLIAAITLMVAGAFVQPNPDFSRYDSALSRSLLGAVLMVVGLILMAIWGFMAIYGL